MKYKINMENKTLHPQSKAVLESQKTIIDMLRQYFYEGNFEHQLSLVGNAIADIVHRGADDRDESLDNDFEYTNRYIRESVYDLVELQKFLMRLHVTYADYKRVVNRDHETGQNKPAALKVVLGV